MKLKLLRFPDPFLNKKVAPFDFDKYDAKQIEADMIAIMDKENGVGLSANQVGLALRMFVYGDNKHYVPCFNPKILEYGGPEVAIEEGCLTYPGLFVKIYRSEWIVAEWEDENRELHKENFTGLQSRVFQHEYDHMEGIDFLSRAGKVSLDMAKRKVKKAMRKMKKMRENGELT